MHVLQLGLHGTQFGDSVAKVGSVSADMISHMYPSAQDVHLELLRHVLQLVGQGMQLNII